MAAESEKLREGRDTEVALTENRCLLSELEVKSCAERRGWGFGGSEQMPKV